MTLFIHAPNVHQGGGKTLLLGLINKLRGPAVLHLDARLSPLPSLASNIDVASVWPSVWGRFGIEWRLKQKVRRGDQVLCFGNLPPVFPVSGQVCVFLQNAYLVRPRLQTGLHWKLRARVWVERLWLRAFLRESIVIVQTETMARLAKSALGVRCEVLPFLPPNLPFRAARHGGSSADKQAFDFLYVASGEPHKNHATLFEAWRLLAGSGDYPTLCVTLQKNQYPELQADLARTLEVGARVFNRFAENSDDLADLYGQARRLIYPSLFESFGLPLIEAQQVGLGLVTAELDYVRDVVEPEQTFDPSSAVSIARAVRRSMGQTSTAPAPISVEAFLNRIQGSR